MLIDSFFIRKLRYWRGPMTRYRFLLFFTFMMITLFLFSHAHSEELLQGAGESEAIQGEDVSPVAAGRRVGGLLFSEERALKKPFEFHSCTISVDGNIIASREADSGQSAAIEVDEIDAGEHLVRVDAIYTGPDYGRYSYGARYKYPVSESFTVNVQAGKISHVNLVFGDHGGFFMNLSERPLVSYEVSEVDAPERYGVQEKEAAAQEDPVPLVVVPPLAEAAQGVAVTEQPLVEAFLLTHVLVEKGEGWTKVTLRGDGSFGNYDSSHSETSGELTVDLIGIKRMLPRVTIKVNSPELERIKLIRGEEKITLSLKLNQGRNIVSEIEKGGNAIHILLTNQ